MKTAIKIFLTLVMILSHVQAQELAPEDFARALVLETDGRAAIYEIKLPASVYETVVRRDLGDMRVFNANEERVPHTLRKPESVENTEARVSLPFFPLYGTKAKKSAEKLDFTTAEDGAILTLAEQGRALVLENAEIQKYIIDVSRLGKKITALEFVLTGTGDNYVKKLTIEHSKDLNKWRSLLNNATLTRLRHGNHDLEFKRVELPEYYERYLRFSWQDATDGIQLRTVYAILKNKTGENKLHWQSRDAELIDAEQGVYQFDTGGAFSIEQFNIELLEENTLIEASLISRSEPEGSWQQRYQGLFYALQVQGSKMQNEAISIRMVNDRYWQLKVNSNDGMGKIPPRFRFGWRDHSLLFLAHGPGPFTLAFGSGKAGPAERPVAALLNVLNNKRHGSFTGKATISSTLELSGEAAKDKHFDISWQRIILWFVLGSGVLILGLMAFRLLRQMDQ